MSDSKISNRGHMAYTTENKAEDEEYKDHEETEDHDMEDDGHKDEEEEEEEEEKGDELDSSDENAIEGTHNIANFQLSYDPAGPYDMHDRDGNMRQYYLEDPAEHLNDPWECLKMAALPHPDYETEEELHRALLEQQEFFLHGYFKNSRMKVGNRFSQWLSTQLDNGVLVPRILNGIPDGRGLSLPEMMYFFPLLEGKKNGKSCCLMHERVLKELVSKGDPHAVDWCKAYSISDKTKGPTYF